MEAAELRGLLDKEEMFARIQKKRKHRSKKERALTLKGQ